MFAQFVQNHWKLLVLCLIAAVFMYVWVYYKRKDLKIKWWGALLVVIVSLVVGIVGQIGLAEVENAIVGYHMSNMRCFGALYLYAIFIVLFSVIAKVDIRTASNILVINGAIIWFFTRVNCYLVNCCYGRLVSTTSSFRYPVREVELAWVVFFIAFFAPKIYKNEKIINCASLFAAVYGLIRFVCDFFREEVYEIAPHFYLSQVWALISLVFGGALLFIDIWKLKKNKASAADETR